MSFDNIPDVREKEEITAQLFNLLKNTLANTFSTGIQSTDISWPLVAQGPLDMNSNDIVNIGSFNGVTHVNASQSLAQAVAVVNAAGKGAIVIDPGYAASTGSGGVTVTADGVKIYGDGMASEIVADATTTGITVTGDDFEMVGVKFSGSAPNAVIISGDRPIVERCRFTGVGGLQLGTASKATNSPEVSLNIFTNTGVFALHLCSVELGDISHNRATVPNAALYHDGTGSSLLDTSLVGNRFASTGGTAASILGSGSGNHRGLQLNGNHFNGFAGGGTALAIEGVVRVGMSGNYLRGDLYFGAGSAQQLFMTGNYVTGTAYLFSSFYQHLTGNSFGELNIGYDGSSYHAATFHQLIGNTVYGDLLLPPSDASGVDVFVGNRINGTATNLDRIVDEGTVREYLHHE